MASSSYHVHKIKEETPLTSLTVASTSLLKEPTQGAMQVQCSKWPRSDMQFFWEGDTQKQYRRSDGY